MRSDRLLLADILDAVDEVIAVTPASRAEFDADKLVRSHVLRHIQIVGEAVTRLSQQLKERYPGVPWRSIAGMRHAIVHGYFQVDWNEVYGTATRDIPPLRSQIRAIIASLPPEADAEASNDAAPGR
ncbi:MAG: DUF86 domain-containing protein [Candidatus Brocadiia bacterium]